jgi:pyruvate kinase
MVVRQVDEVMLSSGRAREGELVVIIAGTPPGTPGSTDAMHVHRVGDAMNEIAPAYRR